MKKTYIAPALKAHQIGVESEILAGSPIGRAIFGNRGMHWNKTDSKYEGSIAGPDMDESIDVIEDIEGNEWSTL